MTTCKGCRWLVMTLGRIAPVLRQARRSRATAEGAKQKPALPSLRRRPTRRWAADERGTRMGITTYSLVAVIALELA